MATIFLFVMVIGFLLIGVPIAIALGLSSIVFLLIYSDSSFASIAQQYYNAFDEHYTLTAIPFFILASAFMSTGGVAQRIIRFSISLVGHIRGGLAIASVVACMMFAALSGSSPATVVAIGTIVIAGMRQVGYTKEFAAGVICNAGTLGILIPPSIVMVVYASSVDVSVGRMFLAGIVPGLVAGLMLMIGIYVAARVKNLPKQPFPGFGEIFQSGRDAVWGLFLILIILGGIYGGAFTPTEAAAISAVYAFFVANYVYRDMGPFDRPIDGEERARAGFRILLLSLAAFAAVWALSDIVTGAIWGAIVFAALLVYAIVAKLAWQRDRYRALVLTVAGAITVLFFLHPALAGFVKGQLGNVVPLLSSAWYGPLLSLLVLLLVVVTVAIFFFFSALIARIIASPAGAMESVGSSLVGGARILVTQAPRAAIGIMDEDNRRALFEAGKLTVTLLFIIANALILKHVLTEEQIPQAIAGAIVDAGFGPIVFLVLVNVILLIGGQFMEPSGLLVIVAPLVFPVAISLGIDPIHLGIIMVVNMEIGMITPPVGLNLFVTSGVAGMSMVEVVRAALPWVGILFIFLIMVTYIPALSTLVPNAFMGPEIITR